MHTYIHATSTTGRVAFFCPSYERVATCYSPPSTINQYFCSISPAGEVRVGRKEGGGETGDMGRRAGEGKAVWMKASKECTKQHLQRRRGGDGCGCKREKAFPNNICNERNICGRRARREEGAIVDGLMMVGVTTRCRAGICS